MKMQKSTRAFLITAVLIAALALIFFLLLHSWGEEVPSPELSISVPETSIPEPEALDTAPPTTTAESMESEIPTFVSEDVPLATDEAGSILDEEYLDWSPYSDPYTTPAGKIYVNDKVLSIDIPVDADGITHTYQFGVDMEGQGPNKYLYINPYCADATLEKKYGYYMKASKGGLAMSHQFSCEEAAAHVAADSNVIIESTYDLQYPASFHSKTDPGAIWFSPTGVDDPDNIWVDIRVIELASFRMIATMRLTITQNPDGTYALSSVENKNLKQNNALDIPEMALGAVQHTAMDTLRSGDVMYLASDEYGDERFIIERLEESDGSYFPSGRPLQSHNQVIYSKDMLYPCYAVTFNANYGGFGLITIYVGEVVPFTKDSPGEYISESYDFTTPFTQDNIQNTIFWD